MNTNKNAFKCGNFEPKPDCKVSVEHQRHPIVYPNNLKAPEYHELYVGSAIHPALIKRNFFHIEGESIYDYLFISDKIPRKNAGRVTDGYLKLYQHLLLGGTWIQSLDPLNNWLPMEWGRIKPNFPRIDWQTGKFVKYESPPKTANRVTYFDVPNCILNRIARRYNIPNVTEVLFAKRGQKLHIKSRKKNARFLSKTLRLLGRAAEDSLCKERNYTNSFPPASIAAHLCNSQLARYIFLLALCRKHKTQSLDILVMG